MELLPLLCLCLLTRSGVTSAQLNGSKNITVKGGTDAVLPCSLSTKEDLEFKLFVWRKVAQKDDGQKEVFMYDAGIHYNNGLDGQSEEFKERVSHFQDELKHGNTSIIIRNTTISDSGNYTCYFPRLQPPQTFYIEFLVKPDAKVLLKEDRDVMLPCSLSTKENIKSKPFEWRKVTQKDPKNVLVYNGRIDNNLQHKDFIGRVFHFPDELKHGNASIIIRNTKISDSGVYTCHFPRLQPPQTFYIELVVDPVLKDRSGENIQGAAPEPFVTTHHTNYGVLLQCKVHGTPKPRVEWQDSAGNILPAEEPQVSERGGHFYITLNATVTETDDYRCVATQETISHQIFTRIYVNGAAPEPFVTTHHTNYGVLLQCKVHGTPKPRVEWQDSAGNILPAEEPQVSERGGHFYITLNATVTETDDYRCVATQETISHQISTRIYVNEFSTGWTVGLVLLALVGLAVLVYMGYIILNRNKESPNGWIVALVLAGVLAVLVYMGYITFSHNEEFSTGWTVGLVLLALLALVALVDLIGLVCKRCIPLNCNKESPNGWIVAIVFAGVLAVLVYMGYITFSHNEESPTGWTVDLVLLALVAVVALVVLAVLVYKRCNPLKHNKDEEYEDVQNPSKSHGSTPEPNALHPFMMEERH